MLSDGITEYWKLFDKDILNFIEGDAFQDNLVGYQGTSLDISLKIHIH